MGIKGQVFGMSYCMHIPHTCYMFRQCHLPCAHHTRIWWKVRITKFLIMQYSLFVSSTQGGWDGQAMRHICRRMKNAHRVLVENPERENVKYRRRWQYSIKTDVEGLGWKAVEWTSLAGSCEWGNEPSGATQCGEFLDWLNNYQLLREYSAP